MKQWLKTLLVIVLIAGSLVIASNWPRGTVRGTEEVCVGTVVDHAMSVVEEKDCKLFCTCESRGYIAFRTEDGGGENFWLSDLCRKDGYVFAGDVVRIESAIEKDTGFRVATKITLLEKNSKWHDDPRYQ